MKRISIFIIVIGLAAGVFLLSRPTPPESTSQESSSLISEPEPQPNRSPLQKAKPTHSVDPDSVALSKDLNSKVPEKRTKTAADPESNSENTAGEELHKLSQQLDSLFQDPDSEESSKRAVKPSPKNPEPGVSVVVNRDNNSRPEFAGGAPSSADTDSGLSRSDLVVPSPSPTATPTPEPELPFVSGQSRGYTMLYLMQPQARATVEAELEILLNSKLRDVHLGVLVDGTFGWDPSYLSSVITRIASEGRRLTLTLYLSNGATQRILDESPIDSNFPQTSPEEFRELIQFDPVTRETFQALARRTVPLFALNRRFQGPGGNVAVPMLEDNLDADSYRAIKSLTQVIVGELASIIRNPCPGCYEGNDSERAGSSLELHGRENISLLQAGDAFSLDGSGYVLNREAGSPRTFSASEFFTLLERLSQSRIRYVGLWRPDRQGLLSGPLTVPNRRTYALPTSQHESTEQEFLRTAQREE